MEQNEKRPLVSVIIPSYNRFKYLLNAVESVKAQTYPNIEIIVINDRSSQEQYYAHNFDDIIVIHLDQNSKSALGFACAAYVRNAGIKVAKGKYVAFLDDDDIWLPIKLERQIEMMQATGAKMSCTEGYLGHGVYDIGKKYPKYLTEVCFEVLRQKYRHTTFLTDGFPPIWNDTFLKIHNCCITSSVIVEKEILIKVGCMKLINFGEDYDCWLKVIKNTTCAYVQEPCFYYDSNHGDGQLYN